MKFYFEYVASRDKMFSIFGDRFSLMPDTVRRNTRCFLFLANRLVSYLYTLPVRTNYFKILFSNFAVLTLAY